MTQWIFLILAPLLFFTACSESEKPSKPDSKVEGQGTLGKIENALNIIDPDGKPIAGAKVLIGRALNDPFVGNFFVTDANGQIPLPEAWKNAQPITVQANGYVRLTQFARLPQVATFQLRGNSKQPSLEINGATIGHQVKNYDGNIDFGLVMSAMSRNDILTLDLNKVISNQVDKISVAGVEVEIPSNITLPRQSESYLFFPITLDKPNYRLSFSEKGVQRIFAAAGKFPFKTVIDQMRGGKKFYDVINLFSITSGVVRDVNVANGVRQDLPIGELSFAAPKNFKAPNINSNQVLITLATADMNGWLVPTDLKRLQANQTVAMTTLTGKTNFALGVLKNADEFDSSTSGADRLSAVILPFQGALSPQFLSLIPDPKVLGNGDLQSFKPASLRGVNALATYAIYSEVKEIPLGSGDAKLPFLNRLWEVYAPEWVDHMDMPVWPEGTPKPAKKRWEVSYIGSQLKDKVDLGQAVIDAATHVTHSSLDF